MPWLPPLATSTSSWSSIGCAGPWGWARPCSRLNADVASRRETGHAGAGQPVPDWDLAAFAPAGRLRSAVADMVRFLRANLQPEHTNLVVALEDPAPPPSHRCQQVGAGR